MMLPRFILAALVAAIACLTLRAPAAEPTTHPSEDVIVTSLDDPTTPSAKCYLSLQSGHQSTFGESSPDDLNASRTWLRKNGVDVMSESREPVQGFVAYDMVLVPTDVNVYDIAQYEAVQSKVRSLDAEPFQAIRLREGERKTYLFRTRDGSIGAIDVT